MAGPVIPRYSGKTELFDNSKNVRTQHQVMSCSDLVLYSSAVYFNFTSCNCTTHRLFLGSILAIASSAHWSHSRSKLYYFILRRCLCGQLAQTSWAQCSYVSWQLIWQLSTNSSLLLVAEPFSSICFLVQLNISYRSVFLFCNSTLMAGIVNWNINFLEALLFLFLADR